MLIGLNHGSVYCHHHKEPLRSSSQQHNESNEAYLQQHLLLSQLLVQVLQL